jgi:hypothetical protein
MRPLSAILGFALIFGLAGCSTSDQEKAKEQAREDVRKAADDATKAGHEIKKDAKELGNKVDASMQPGGSASNAMDRADIKLDHAALVAKVKTKLASDAGLATLKNVDVNLDGGVVTLSGTAANESQKKAAEIAASQVEGVTHVRNHLTVQP